MCKAVLYDLDFFIGVGRKTCAGKVGKRGRSTDVTRIPWKVFSEEFCAVTDNPIVMDEGDVVSAGNFHGQPLGMQMDFAAIALAEIGNISERRTYLLLGGEDQLPKLLMQDTGLPVVLAEEPLTCVVRGCGRALEEMEAIGGQCRRFTFH